MNELALFAGAGGGILGGKLLGWRTACAVEIDPYCRSVLLARQRDGMLPIFPIWDDVRTFDGLPWHGHVDVVTGGFPCQDISTAGRKTGINGENSGLFFEMARIIREVRPRFAFMENSPALVHRGLGDVLGVLADMGMDARWCVLGADSVGFPQIRKRIFILAYPVRRDEKMGWNLPGSWGEPEQVKKHMARPSKSEPPMVGVADGVGYRMDGLRAIGNGQVPAVVKLAWDLLSGGLE